MILLDTLQLCLRSKTLMLALKKSGGYTIMLEALPDKYKLQYTQRLTAIQHR